MPVRKAMRDVVAEKAVPLRVTVEVPPQAATPEVKPVNRVEVSEPMIEKPRPAFLSQERREERRANYPGGPLLPTDSRPKRRGFLWVLLFVVLILVGGGLVATSRAKATLTVTPRAQVAEVDSSFHAYKNDVPAGALGFQTLEITASESASVPAGETKHVERKTTGKVTFYNSFSKDVVRLVANTRVKTADGKVFRTNSVVTIPGYRTVSGQIEPGKIDATVTADVAGAAYNIAPSEFTLPGLFSSPMYEKVTAKSSETFTGGLAGDVRSVKEEDVTSARNTLEATLSQKLLADLESKLPKGTIFFPDAYSTNFTLDEYGTPSADGTEASDTQTITVHGTLTAVLFDKQALATFLAKRVLPAAADATLDIGNWKDLNVEISDTDNISLMEEVPVAISGNAQFVWQIDEAALKQDLVGKPKSEYSQVFLGYPAIDRAEVRISPFWVKRFPQDPSRIDIEIKVS